MVVELCKGCKYADKRNVAKQTLLYPLKFPF